MAPNQEVPSPAASELEAPATGSPDAAALLCLDAAASSAPAGEGEQPAHASEAEQALPADSTPAPGPAQGLDLAEYAPARGTITLAATPIGNRGDASPRLMAALSLADVVAAEDTRRALNLAQRLGVKIGGRLLAFHEHNERERSRQLLQAARGGSSVLMISDAGMPSVSDPGFRLVNAAIDADVPVTVAPGPSAVLTALALSGLASDRFSFEGFLPRKSGERARLLSSLASDAHTLIFFESPRRVHETLTDLAKAFGGQRRAALCRELTKTHEEVLRASLDELVAATAEGARGEIVLVVAGSTGASVGVEQVVDQVLALADQGLRLKQAAAQVAQTHGLRKNELYQAALAAREN